MPKDDQQYLNLDSLSPDEREVFDLAMAALSLPITKRQAFFIESGLALQKITGHVENL